MQLSITIKFSYICITFINSVVSHKIHCYVCLTNLTLYFQGFINTGIIAPGSKIQLTQFGPLQVKCTVQHQYLAPGPNNTSNSQHQIENIDGASKDIHKRSAVGRLETKTHLNSQANAFKDTKILYSIFQHKSRKNKNEPKNFFDIAFSDHCLEHWRVSLLGLLAKIKVQYLFLSA